MALTYLNPTVLASKFERQNLKLHFSVGLQQEQEHKALRKDTFTYIVKVTGTFSTCAYRQTEAHDTF